MTGTIIEQIDDLIVQATKERSHFYVKTVLVDCKVEIEALNRLIADRDAQIDVLEDMCATANGKYD